MKSDILLQLVMEMRAPLWIVNAKDLSFVHVNQAAIDLYGYSKEEFQKLTIPQIDIFDNEEVVAKRTERIKKYGEEEFETKHQTNFGNILDVIVSVKLHIIDNEILLTCIIHNKTKSRGLEEQFKAIFENIHDGLLILNHETQTFSYANHAVLNMLDYSIDEINKLSFKNIVAKDKWNELEKEFQKSFVGKNSFFRRITLITKDGESFIADIDVSIPYTINEGLQSAFLIKDVTFETENQLLLEQTTKRYETLFNQLPEAAWIIDPMKRAFIDVNSKAEKLYGYTKNEFLNLSPHKINPDIDEKAIAAHYKYILENENFSTEEIHYKKDGTPMNVLISITKVFIEDYPYLSVIATDITNKKREEEIYLMNLRQAQMGEMISMIAHQWRQPLTLINAVAHQIHLSAVMDKYDPEKTVENTRKIEKTTGYLSQTIDDFRNLFKPDQKKEKTSLTRILNLVNSIMKDNIRAEDINLQLDIDNIELTTYSHEVVQVFIAIIRNSIDAFNSQQIKSRYINIAAFKDNSYVKISLCDNAGGIQGIDINDIFLPYKTSKDNLNGTGLGLYMAQNIIEKHCQGTIEASNQNEGVCFNIKLPLGIF